MCQPLSRVETRLHLEPSPQRINLCVAIVCQSGLIESRIERFEDNRIRLVDDQTGPSLHGLDQLKHASQPEQLGNDLLLGWTIMLPQ
jgi:hypothetical protein